MKNKEAYSRLVKKRAACSPTPKNCFAAFWVGGLICLIGALLKSLYASLGADDETAGILASVSLIFLSALFTALDLYDGIARYAGGGTLVPVTGFANAVVSPALDNKSEGLLFGVGTKIFTVAGPVILFGILAGALYGVLYFLSGVTL